MPAERRTPQVFKLLQYICIGLSLIAAVEYFKYGTRTNYEWFHCNLQEEAVRDGSSAVKLFAVGGPSCDKRGEFKTIVKKITHDYDLQKEHVSFCIKEELDVSPVHYPVHEKKGIPGYVAYVGYDSDSAILEDLCEDATIMHI